MSLSWFLWFSQARDPAVPELAARHALLGETDNRDMTPLHHACFHGRPMTAEWLVTQVRTLAFGAR
jgi:hypothetical protein